MKLAHCHFSTKEGKKKVFSIFILCVFVILLSGFVSASYSDCEIYGNCKPITGIGGTTTNNYFNLTGGNFYHENFTTSFKENVSIINNTKNIQELLNGTNMNFFNLFMGNADENHNIFFYESAGFNENISWNDALDSFIFSDEVRVEEDLIVGGYITAGGVISGSSDIYTIGAGDDFWLGNNIQENARVQIFATGNATFENITADWLNGKFNWTTDETINFTGSFASINKTWINETIDNKLIPDYYNKSEVDNIASAIAFDFFFTNHSSDIVGHYNFTETDEGHAESSLTTANLPVGFHNIFNFTTEIGQPEFNKLRSGVYDVRLHLFKTGTRSVIITPKLYNISADGLFKTLLITFETSIELTTIDDTYDLHGILSEEIILADGNRLHMEFLAEVFSGGSNPTITLDMEGTTDTHISVETSSNAFENIFLRQDGSKPLNNNWDVGNFNITNISDLQANDLNVIGDFNVTGISYLDDVIIDSLNTTNQVNLSGVLYVDSINKRVGINAIPSYTMHMKSNVNLVDRFVIENTNAGTSSSIGIASYSTSGGAYMIYGTTSNAYNQLNFFETGGDDVAYLYSTNSKELVMGTYTNVPFILGTNNLERVRIDTGGKVGIGIKSVTYPLEVGFGVSNISAYFHNQTSATGYITRTSVYDKSKDVWDYIKDADYYKDKDKINHSKFYGYTSYEVPDVSIYEMKNVPCKSIDIETNLEYETTCEEKVYPYNKIEEGVLLDKEMELLRQAVYELKQENNLMGESLCKLGEVQWC